MTDVRKVRASLEELGMQVTSAGLEFVPRTLMSLDQDQLNSASTLIEALNDYPDVVRVWDNIQADSWEHFLDTLWTLNLFHVEYLILQRKVLSADTLYCLSLSIWKFVCFDARDKVGIKIKWWCLFRCKVIFFLNIFCHLTAPEVRSQSAWTIQKPSVGYTNCHHCPSEVPQVLLLASLKWNSVK